MFRPNPLLLTFLLSVGACKPTPGDASVAPATVPAAAPEPAEVPKVSEDPVVQGIVELARADNRAQEHLLHLTREIGPRLTSSHALMEAERWCRDQFAAYGLDARLERWGEYPVGFDRGPWSGRVVGSTGDLAKLEFTTRAWTPGAFGPVRGRAVAYPETLADLKKLGGQLEGSWVLRPRWRRGGPAKKLRAKIDKALAAAGIAGQVVRVGGEEGELVHTGGKYAITWDELPTDVEIRLRGSQYDAILEALEGGEAVELEFSIDNRFFNGPVPQYNVIADIPGTEKPEEYVIVGGHIDSWDGAEGAVDNGTGVATTMEAARLLAAVGARPKRTIRFMLWSGEEQGLLGSTGYVDAHPDEMERISAVFVHDGGTNYLSGLHVTPEMMEQMRTVFAPIQGLDPAMPFALEEAESLRPGGSDHSPFIAKGVPGFFWKQDGKSDYDHMHHTQFDTFETAVPEYQAHSSIVVAIAAWNVANLDEKIDRTNSEPFPSRKMGADFDGTKILSVKKKGKAAAAGWRAGDEIVAVDGQEVDGLWGLFKHVQTGGPKKAVRLRRDGAEVETLLDFSGGEGEDERARRRAERAERFGSRPESQPESAATGE